MDVEAVAEAVAKVYLARVRTAAGLIDEMRSALIKYAAVRATYLRRTLEESLQSFSNEMGFFAFAEKARAQTRKRRPAQPYSSKAGRCFYNALDYVHRHQGANLAYGYEAETRELQAAKESYIDAVSQFEADRTGKLPLVSVLDVTVHAFVEEGGGHSRPDTWLTIRQHILLPNSAREYLANI